jgi:hypothetical protein
MAANGSKTLRPNVRGVLSGLCVASEPSPLFPRSLVCVMRRRTEPRNARL